MNIPLDRLYHYIESVASEVRNNDVLIYRFYPHGSKNINDLSCTRKNTSEENTYCPQLICNDQEPLNYELYQDVPVHVGKYIVFTGDPDTLPKRNLRIRLGNIYDHCLLLHSEQHSLEVLKYQQDQFVPVYYWSHAIISRDWFRYAKCVKFNKNIKKTFLIYNRAWAGTREYRLKFADLLVKNDLLEHCQTSFNSHDNKHYYKTYSFNNSIWKPDYDLEQYFSPSIACSNYSADFDITDYNATEFEIVLETLFDDQRHHLTEKTLRPIACNQPFILASSAGSLKYLRSYGFQTFSDIFDESYDLIQDPMDRMNKIIETMKEISQWDPEYKLLQMKKIKEITKFNQLHFFSNNFFNTVVDELKNNLIKGFDYIENNNIGLQYRDILIKNIPGMREYRKSSSYNKHHKLNSLKKLKEYRKKNRTGVK
jgi:hypothetical protein